MIRTLDDGTVVSYLGDKFQPVEPGKATLVKVRRPDGTVVFARPAAAEEAREAVSLVDQTDQPYGGNLASHVAVPEFDKPGIDPGQKFNLKPSAVDLTGYEPSEVRMVKVADILPRKKLTKMVGYAGGQPELSLLAKELVTGTAKMTPLTVADLWYKTGEYAPPTYLTTPPVKISKDWGRKALLLDGHRRLSAALALGIPRVPVIYRKPTADNLLGYYGGQNTSQGPEPTAEADLRLVTDDGVLVDGKRVAQEATHEPERESSSGDSVKSQRTATLKPSQIDLHGADPKRVRMVSVQSLHPRLALPGGHGPEHPEEVAEKIESGEWKMRPLTAVKRPEGGLWIIDGHRRYGAAQLKGWTKLPVVELETAEAQEAVVWHAGHVRRRMNLKKQVPEKPYFSAKEGKPMTTAADIIREDAELMQK